MNLTTLLRFYPADFGRFLRGWMDDPWSVGAVAPSGRALGELMTRDIRPTARVLELGPGTGTLTRAILARGVDPRRLVLLERGRKFVPQLKETFAEVTVIEADATRLAPQLDELRGRVDFVVSGLPLVLFSRQQKRVLLESSFEMLGPAGAYLQFTYGGRCPINRRLLRELGLRATRLGLAARNIPPAIVYRIERDRVSDAAI
jgi:phospholipid N-methyltransferase